MTRTYWYFSYTFNITISWSTMILQIFPESLFFYRSDIFNHNNVLTIRGGEDPKLNERQKILYQRLLEKRNAEIEELRQKRKDAGVCNVIINEDQDAVVLICCCFFNVLFRLLLLSSSSSSSLKYFFWFSNMQLYYSLWLK